MNKEEQKKVPELRFPEFEKEGEWEDKVFEEVFDRLTTKNGENNQNVLTISAQLGLVSQLEYFKKKVSAKDVSGYYLLHKGDFAYNKSYSKGYPMGAIKLLKYYDKGVVSTLYICFRAKDSYNGSFFEQYFNAGLLNSEIGNIAQEGGRAHGLLNVSVKEFFKDVNLLVPKPQEQQKIADCLSFLDDLIGAETEKLDSLKVHKKGLLQQLFPAEGETVPKLRFPEFENDNDWNKEVFGDVAVFTKGKGIAKSDVNVNGMHACIRYGELYTKYNEVVRTIISKTNIPANKLVLSEENDVIIPSSGETQEDIATASCVLKSGIALGGDINIIRSNIHGVFLAYYLNNAKKRDIAQIAQGNAVVHLYTSQLAKLEIEIPKPKEQKKIADCLSSIDKSITAQFEKLNALNDYKKGLMQQLFPTLKVT